MIIQHFLEDGIKAEKTIAFQIKHMDNDRFDDKCRDANCTTSA